MTVAIDGFPLNLSAMKRKEKRKMESNTMDSARYLKYILIYEFHYSHVSKVQISGSDEYLCKRYSV